MNHEVKINSIPKIIHYCWFGHGKKTRFILKCMCTWQKVLPDYQIMEWNEDNFPVEYNDYVSEAYKSKKYAFVSDVARLYALSQFGGIYFDIDIEARKSLDLYLEEAEVIMAFESNKVIMTGFFAARQDSKFIKEWLAEYRDIRFLQGDGTFDVTPNTFRISNILEKQGLILNGKKQILKNSVNVYPKEIFGGYDVDNSAYITTADTVMIHHCKNSWRPFKYKVTDFLKRTLAKILGVETYRKIRMRVKYRKNGR